MIRYKLLTRHAHEWKRRRLKRWLGLMVTSLMFLQGFGLPVQSGWAQEATSPFKLNLLQRAWSTNSQRPTFVPGEVLVKYKSSAKASAVESVEQKFQLTRSSYNWSLSVVRYKIPSTQGVLEMATALSNDPAVEFAEPNFYRSLHITPNDPLYANVRLQGTTFPNSLQRWVYNGVGANRNVNGEAAWDLTTGRPDVVVAIIDSGVLLSHPDLQPNIWRNPGEIPRNARDDDGNGFIDDVNGWDFRGHTHDGTSHPDNDPNPDVGDGLDNDRNGAPDDAAFHGTFVAGIVGARGNDGVGIAGTSWNCQLMALKVFTDDGLASAQDITDAITYAATNGAAVINLSLGSTQPSQTERLAIEFAHDRDVLVVASAGNDNTSEPNFPASFDHVISVGASDYAGDLPINIPVDINGRASFSQFGPAAVDVVAPGIVASTTVITTADQQNGEGIAGDPSFNLSGGTSFSGPLVAGLAALVISRARALNLAITNDQVEDIIQTTTVDLPDDPDDSPDAGPDWDGRGRVDMRAVLNAVTGGPPSGNTVVLRSGVPVMGSLPAPPPGQAVLGDTQYSIQVPTGATQLQVTLRGNQDVDLFVRFGQRIVLTPSGQLLADLASTSPTGDEVITITPMSSPPLRPGTYFMAVANFGPGAATFTITATVTRGSSGNTVALMSGVPATGSIPAPQPGGGLLGETQYTIQVPNGATQLTVTLSGNQDVDLLVRFGQPIMITPAGDVIADFGSVSPTGNEVIIITPADSPPLQSGTYFIAVLNFGPGAATFTVTATVSP